MTNEELREILDKHYKWLNNEEGGERADLSGAYLRDAILAHVDLRYADLNGAILRYADLSDANLSGADLRNATLIGADLTRAVYTDTVLNLQCPEEGSFIAWKKLAQDSIAKLLIPGDAERTSGTSRKCRASKAIVLAIYDKNGEDISQGTSRRDYGFMYWIGETVYPDCWDDNRWNECSNGIHFFVTRKEAEEY